MFLFFKNTVKKQKFSFTFYQFRKSLQNTSIITTAFMLKLDLFPLLQMIKKEKIFLRKMFIVADLVSLNHLQR